MKAKKPTKNKKKEQMVNKKSTKNDTRVHIHNPETKACDSTREEKINITKDLKYSFYNRIQV